MSKEIEKLITYEPDNSIKKGYTSLFKEIYYELKDNKWLCYQLFKRDFTSMYKQSFMGVLWALIVPIISVATFVFLNKAGIFNLGEIKIPYTIYAITGMAVWQIFATGLIASSGALVKVGAMIMKINFSKKSLIISSMGQALVSLLIQLAFLIILFIYFGYFPNIKILLLPLLLLPIIIITLGLGFIFSILNAVMRDVGNALGVLINFLMFLTPILYVKPKTGLIAKLADYNPLYYLTVVPRDLILVGYSSEIYGFVISSIVSVIIMLVCIIAFHLTETRIAERI